MKRINDDLLATIYLDRQPSNEVLMLIGRGLGRHARTWGEFQLSYSEATDGAVININNSGFANAGEAIMYVTNVLAGRGYEVKDVRP